MCCYSATSATSHVVLGQFKTCVIMLGGYIFFNSDPGVISICGAIAALGGMSVYTSLNLQRPKDATSNKAQLLPKHGSDSTAKPKTEEDDESSEKINANLEEI